jgi:GNAT superfamily N-acetyltransferase
MSSELMGIGASRHPLQPAIVMGHGAKSVHPVLIRNAWLAEQSSLTDLQRRASMHWEAYREQLVAHPDAVELPVHQIQAGLVRVAEVGTEVVGFAVLLEPERGACELDGLFVEPAHMGAGVGRALVEDAMRIARGRGATAIEVVANPEAVAFYHRLGFTGAEQVPTRFGPARRMRLPV